jgi:hypothetical protein
MLFNARMRHLKWVSEAQHCENVHVEVDHSQCEFGTWYLAASEKLRDLQEFKDLNVPHCELHAAYKLIKSTPDLDVHLAEEIRHHSNKLIYRNDLLEKRLHKLMLTG